MGFIIGFITKLIKIFLYFLIFFAFIVLIPNLPPYTKFTRIEPEPTLPREGALALNGALNNVQKLYENKLHGPEAFQVYDGELYTSLATGEIVKVSPGGHVTFVTKIGPPCTGLIQEHICGRPLGFKIDEKNKQLYVADAYLGIWKVDLKTDKKQLLVSPSVEVQGCQPKLFNDLVLDKEGILYYTVSSCDFQLKDGTFTFLADPSGRILQYNAAKNESTVLLDNSWFPNGITISPDNDYLLVTETLSFKVIKYYIRGPKKGQKETFISGLPGLPDNIRALPDGSGVLVALYSSFDDQDPLLSRTLASVPIVRKFLARMQRLVEIPFEFLNDQFPHIMFEEIVYYIGSFKSLSGLSPSTSGLLHLDWNGNVIGSYYNSDRSIKHVSDAIVYKDVLHLGNPHLQNFIGGSPVPTPLKQAFIAKKPNLVKEVKKSKDESQVQTEKVKEKEELKERKESTETVKPQKPTPTISKTTTKPEVKIHTTPKPEEKTYTTPKPEAEKHTTFKPEQKKDTAPKPEERKKETTSKQNTEPHKQTESKTTGPKKQPDSQLKTPPKPSENKPLVNLKPAESKTEKPKAEPKIDISKQTDTKPTKPPKPSETKPTPPPKQADEKPKTAKQAESKSEFKRSESKEKVKEKEKITPSKQTPPPKQAEPNSSPPKQSESKTITPKHSESKSTPSHQTESKISHSKQTESKSTNSNQAEGKSPHKPADAKSKESIEKTKSEQKTRSDPESKPIQKETTKPMNTKPTQAQIPVKEDIQSDTAKPYKETIKVIKKEGPTEIPNLNP